MLRTMARQRATVFSRMSLPDSVDGAANVAGVATLTTDVFRPDCT